MRSQLAEIPFVDGVLYQGTTSVVPHMAPKTSGLQPLREAVAQSATAVEASAFRPRNTASQSTCLQARNISDSAGTNVEGPLHPGSPAQSATTVEASAFPACGKTLRDGGFVSRHNFRACGKTLRDARLVSGHDFSRAAHGPKNLGASAPAQRGRAKRDDGRSLGLQAEETGSPKRWAFRPGSSHPP